MTRRPIQVKRGMGVQEAIAESFNSMRDQIASLNLRPQSLSIRAEARKPRHVGCGKRLDECRCELSKLEQYGIEQELSELYGGGR